MAITLPRYSLTYRSLSIRAIYIDQRGYNLPDHWEGVFSSLMEIVLVARFHENYTRYTPSLRLGLAALFFSFFLKGGLKTRSKQLTEIVHLQGHFIVLAISSTKHELLVLPCPSRL